MKSGLQTLVIVLLSGLGLQGQEITGGPLQIELSTSRTRDLLDTEITGSVVNRGSSAIDVTLPSGTFPFELEVLDGMGNDVLAKYRKPSPTYRRREAATQTVHLKPSEKKSFRITLRAYLDSRDIPREVDKVERLRLLVPASTQGPASLAVVRSNVVDVAAAR